MYKVKGKEELLSIANRRSTMIDGFLFETNNMCKALVFTDSMFEYCGQECEIVPLDQVEKKKPSPYNDNETNYNVNNWFRIDIDNMEWWWRLDWLEEINDKEIIDIDLEELI